MKKILIALFVLISMNSCFAQRRWCLDTTTAKNYFLNGSAGIGDTTSTVNKQDSLLGQLMYIQGLLENMKPEKIQVGATDQFYIEMEGDQRVSTEILYTVSRERDSTQTNFMINTDGSLTYRKFDCEMRMWSEWKKLDLTPANITDSGYLIILNGSKYYIRRR